MVKTVKIFFSLLISCLLLSAQYTTSKDIILYLPSLKTKTLVPHKTEIIYSRKSDLAGAIFDALKIKTKASGYIELFSPDSSAHASGTAAAVNISKRSVPGLEDKLNIEYLTIYSAVNSITSTGDIVTVNFTIDGKEQKDFYGYVDMRETFIPDYSFCS